jgi:streptogramin lyase
MYLTKIKLLGALLLAQACAVQGQLSWIRQTTANLTGIGGMVVNSKGNVFVTDYDRNRIYQILSNGTLINLAGPPTTTAGGYSDSGWAMAAQFRQPWGLALTASGDLIIADYGNHAIRRVNTRMGEVTTVAGVPNGVVQSGYVDGDVSVARFNLPADVAVDSEDNIYVADSGNGVIRLISPNGSVSTYIGGGNVDSCNGVMRTSVRLGRPFTVDVDQAGNVYTIRQAVQVCRFPLSGTALAVAGGSNSTNDGVGPAAGFNDPQGLAVSPSGVIFVADSRNNRVRRISSQGVVSTIANSSYPSSIAFGPDEELYVGEYGLNRISRFTGHIRYALPKWRVSTIAGNGSAGGMNGVGQRSTFNQPEGVVINSGGDSFICDSLNHVVRRISGSTGQITTFAGTMGVSGFTNGPAASCRFNRPTGIAIDSTNNIYVADSGNNVIRRITPAGAVTTYAGTGTRGFVNGNGTTVAQFNNPGMLAMSNRNILYVSDIGNLRIRAVAANGSVSTVIGGGTGNCTVGNPLAVSVDPAGLAVNSWGDVYFINRNQMQVCRLLLSTSVVSLTAGGGSTGYVDGKRETSRFNAEGLAVLQNTNIVYFADTLNNVVRRLSSQGDVITVAGSSMSEFGDGKGADASFFRPTGIALASNGDLVVTDKLNNRVRRVSSGLDYSGRRWQVSTAFGDGGAGFLNGANRTSRFSGPQSMVVSPDGIIYVADSNNNRIRRIFPNGTVGTLAGTGVAGFQDGAGDVARFTRPQGIALNLENNILVADSGNHRVRLIDALTGTVTTVAGSSTAGFLDGNLLASRFNNPTHVACFWNVIYVLDANNNALRLIQSSGVITLNTYATGTLQALAKLDYNYNLMLVFQSPFQTRVYSPGSDYNFTKTSESLPFFSDGMVGDASFGMAEVVADNSGTIYFSDRTYNVIRRVSENGMVQTIAGNGFGEVSDGRGHEASFNEPRGLAIGPNGALLVCDTRNNMIRRLTPPAPRLPTAFGFLSSFVGGIFIPGHRDGQGSNGLLGSVTYGIAFDRSGNMVFTDAMNAAIRKVTPSGFMTTIAGNNSESSEYWDGPGPQFSMPSGILNVPGTDDFLILDWEANRIMYMFSNGTVYPWAGMGGSCSSVDGPKETAGFCWPSGIAIHPNGSIYVTEIGSGRIRHIAPNGMVSTVAGANLPGYVDGSAAEARISGPAGIAIARNGDIFFSDYSNHVIRKLSPNGTISTFLGNGFPEHFDPEVGSATFVDASFNVPTFLSFDPEGNLWIADTQNYRIRRFTPLQSYESVTLAERSYGRIRNIMSGNMTTIVGNGTWGYNDGPAMSAGVAYPLGLAVSNGTLYFSDGGRIRRWSPLPLTPIDNTNIAITSTR